MGRIAVSIDVKKNVILLGDTRMSQNKICRQPKISPRFRRQTIPKFDRYETVATRSGALDPRRKQRFDKHDSSNLNKFSMKHILWLIISGSKVSGQDI